MQTTKAVGLYAGADLHGNNVFLSVCDEAGREVFKRRVKCSLEDVNAAMEPYWDHIKAFGVESTWRGPLHCSTSSVSPTSVSLCLSCCPA